MLIRRLTFFSGCFAFIVVALGAWTRLADAGLGCPDWPGCYGFVTLPVNPDEIDLANSRFPDSPYELAKAIPEVVHRYFAATLGFFILSIAAVINLDRSYKPNIKILSTVLLIWVLVQGAFGYLTVSLKLWPQIVSLHLLFGFLTTTLLWLLYFKLVDEDTGLADQWRFTKKLKSLISFASILVFIQIFLGAWTSTNYAAFSCTDFPLCQGKVFPNMNFLGGFNFFQDIGPNYLGGQMDLESRTAIHFTHRIGALVVSLFLSFLAWKIYKDNYKRISFILMGLLLVQILLGVSNIIFQLPLLIAVAHNLGGLSLITYLMVLRFRYQHDN